MANEQQALSFKLGITNVPSDAICDDNALEACEGMVYENGEYRPIQDPVRVMSDVPITVLAVHKTAVSVNYIGYDVDGHVRWGTSVDGRFKEGVYEAGSSSLGHFDDISLLSVAVIGNTLVVSSAEGIEYFLWKAVNSNDFFYKSLGDIPSLDIEFLLQHTWRSCEFPGAGTVTLAASDVLVKQNPSVYEAAITGMYARNKAEAAQNSLFTLPFFAVAAVEMFDGSYTRLTNPILLFPSFTRNNTLTVDRISFLLKLSTGACTLHYRLKTDLSQFADIVKGVTIFITKGVEINEMTAGAPIKSTLTDGYFCDGELSPENMKYRELSSATDADHAIFGMPLEQRTHGIPEDLIADTVYYKIFETGMTYDRSRFTRVMCYNKEIEYLTTQPRLDMVDFYSNTRLRTRKMMVYNSRLILSKVSRSFFDGFHLFSPIYAGSRHVMTYYVSIQTSEGVKVAKHRCEDCWTYSIRYFFYPDTRARAVSVFIDGRHAQTLALKEWPGLGGAYFFGMYDPSDTVYPSPDIAVIERESDYTAAAAEELSNTLVMSENNNPFSFRASGYYDVGTGEIIGISSLTHALSQGQFGRFPLIVFTDAGIWAMTVSGTGYFSNADPISREVCNNPESITQTDGAVFFSTEKGLMAVTGNIDGSNIKISCVSEQLLGDFPRLLATAKIAYDYRDSLLWIVPREASHVGSDVVMSWLYNIKSSTFHRSCFFSPVEEQKDIRSVYRFHGICEDVPVSHVIDGVYSDEAAKAIIAGEEHVSLYSFSLKSTHVIFDLTSNKFYERRTFDYSIDGVSTLSGTRYYTVFDGSENYVDAAHGGYPLATGIVYQCVGTPYYWNGSALVEFRLSNYKRFDGYDNTVHVSAEDIYSTREAFEASHPYTEIAEETVVYDSYQRRFFLKLTSAVGEGNPHHYYLKNWNGSISYVDTSHDGHPVSGAVYYYVADGFYWYFLPDGQVGRVSPFYGYVIYHWNSETVTLEDNALSRHDFDYWDHAAAESVLSERYDEARLCASLAEGHAVELVDFSASYAGIFFARNVGGTESNRFLLKMTCRYVWQGEKTADIFTTMFVEMAHYVNADAGGHPLPIEDGVVYAIRDTYYYFWDVESSVFTPFRNAGVKSVVNSYPDTLFCLEGAGVYSFLERPQAADDEKADYKGCIVTRPLKFGNALSLKSIREIHNVHDMAGRMTFRLFGTNNLNGGGWRELRSLRGMPWKYYQLRFYFEDMRATDRFGGTVIVTQERRANKLR